jgi:hypothetical protein
MGTSRQVGGTGFVDSIVDGQCVASSAEARTAPSRRARKAVCGILLTHDSFGATRIELTDHA